MLTALLEGVVSSPGFAFVAPTSTGFVPSVGLTGAAGSSFGRDDSLFNSFVSFVGAFSTSDFGLSVGVDSDLGSLSFG